MAKFKMLKDFIESSGARAKFNPRAATFTIVAS